MSRIALALGAGGARGIAHIPVLEALDELGIEVAAYAGASVGAVASVLHASGMRGAEIREHLVARTYSRLGLAHRVALSRLLNFRHAIAPRRFGWSLIDAEALLREFLPAGLPGTLEGLRRPVTAVAVDLAEHVLVDLKTGPIVPALAASSAIPSLMRPVRIGERLLIDGIALDPVPTRCLADLGLPIVAVDLSPGPSARPMGAALPHSPLVLMEAAQITARYLAESRFAAAPPALVLRPRLPHMLLSSFSRSTEVLNGLAALSRRQGVHWATSCPLRSAPRPKHPIPPERVRRSGR